MLADSGIASAVGSSRIYPVLLPQGQRNASLVYTRASGIGDHTMTGASGLARPRFQIDAWAATADAAQSLADLVKARIDGYSGIMGSVEVQGVFCDMEREGYDDDVQLFFVGRDYFIWFAER